MFVTASLLLVGAGAFGLRAPIGRGDSFGPRAPTAAFRRRGVARPVVAQLEALFGRAAPSRPAAADELFDNLAAAHATDATPDAAVCSTLVDELCAAGGPFQAQQLGGGLWLSLYARGPTPKWLENANLLRALGVRNRAGQRYDPATSAVANYGEVLGTAISFGAEGTFDLPEGQLRAPCDVPVEIASGGLTVLGRRFDLPIKGPGLVRVRYHDDDLRVFESPNTSPGK